jgi:hypothetical protein
MQDLVKKGNETDKPSDMTAFNLEAGKQNNLTKAVFSISLETRTLSAYYTCYRSLE